MSEAAELYRRHAVDVHRFARHLCSDAALAEDLVSETFVRCLTATVPIRTETVRAYLFTITRNLFYREVRRRSRQVEAGEELPDPEPGAERATADRDRLRRTLRALADFPADDRAALWLRVEQELPYEEIGRVLGVSAAAARVRVHRVRRRLLELET